MILIMGASDFSPLPRFDNLCSRRPNAAFATAPFRHLSSSHSTSSMFCFRLQRHVSADKTPSRNNVGLPRIAASLWPNPAPAVPPPSPADTNGAVELKSSVDSDDRYSFLKRDGSKTVHSGTFFNEL